jgi:hypothetical protein
MMRKVVQGCLAAMVAALVARGAEAARYIKVEFTTNEVPYYRLTNPPVPPFVEQYEKVLVGELLFDTQAANSGNQLSFGGTASSPGTFVQFSNASIYLFQPGGGEDRAISASFTPVDLSAPSFVGTLTSGSFSAYFHNSSHFSLPALTGGSLHSLTFTGFDSDETLTPYIHWSEGAASPAPEPSSWAMLVAGFGLIGAILRYRPLSRRRDLLGGRSA